MYDVGIMVLMLGIFGAYIWIASLLASNISKYFYFISVVYLSGIINIGIVLSYDNMASATQFITMLYQIVIYIQYFTVAVMVLFFLGDTIGGVKQWVKG